MAFFNLASAKLIMFSTHLEKKIESAYKKPGKKKKVTEGSGLARVLFFSVTLSHVRGINLYR